MTGILCYVRVYDNFLCDEKRVYGMHGNDRIIPTHLGSTQYDPHFAGNIFELIFLYEGYFDLNSNVSAIFSEGPINSNPASVLIMAWHRIGKMICGPVMA